MSILATILEAKALEVAERKRERPLAQLPPPSTATRSLFAALTAPPQGVVHVIAEIKRASPSAGAIRPEADAAAIAAEYEAAGASAISVLTDERFFDGRLEFLAAARAATSAAPLLRKDFIIDPYQVAESRAAGADAVLLIVAALADSQLAELHAAANEAGLDALVEIHSEAEAERAVAAGARIIGVNHRDLATFAVDLGLTGRLRKRVPGDAILVAESGIRGPADVARVVAAGARAILVGEQLMRAERPGAALLELLS